MVQKQILENQHKLVEDRLGELMNQIGYSKRAGHVLSKLISLQRSVTAKELVKFTGLPDSNVYPALKELEELIEVINIRPKRYRAASPQLVTGYLKGRVEDEADKQVRKLEKIEGELELLASAESGALEVEDEPEIAYIIKGMKTSISKMKVFINEAAEEIILMVDSIDIYHELRSLLFDAHSRGLTVRLAIPDLLTLDEKDLETFKPSKLLCSTVSSLIVDSKYLITMRKPARGEFYSLITKDEMLVRANREYFDNKNCCETPTSLQSCGSDCT